MVSKEKIAGKVCKVDNTATNTGFAAMAGLQLNHQLSTATYQQSKQTKYH